MLYCTHACFTHCLAAAFQDAPEELDVTITEQSSQQAGAIEQAAAALTAEVGLLAAPDGCCFASSLVKPSACLEIDVHIKVHEGPSCTSCCYQGSYLQQKMHTCDVSQHSRSMRAAG